MKIDLESGPAQSRIIRARLRKAKVGDTLMVKAPRWQGEKTQVVVAVAENGLFIGPVDWFEAGSPKTKAGHHKRLENVKYATYAELVWEVLNRRKGLG